MMSFTYSDSRQAQCGEEHVASIVYWNSARLLWMMKAAWTRDRQQAELPTGTEKYLM